MAEREAKDGAEQSGQSKDRRRDLIVKRWRMVTALAVATLCLCLLVSLIGHDKVTKIGDLPLWSPVIPLGALASLMLFLAPRRFWAWLGVRHAFSYPPYWFGASFGVAGAAALIAGPFADDFHLSDAAAKIFWILAGVTLTAPCIVLLIAKLRRSLVRVQPPSRPWPAPQAPTLAQLEKWIVDDNAVDDPTGDLFGHAEIARRMGQRLLAKQPPAQALVGALGSGKTTICSLVTRWLGEQPEGTTIELVKIELWPYESPRAAVEGILRTLIDALSKEVSTSQLDGVPVAYGEAVAKIAGVSEWLPKILRREVTPTEALRRIDEVATAIGRRYVLWVEDLERFAAGEPDAPAKDGELERLAPIRALLFGLDQLHSITVITATTDLFRRFDLEKIARYVERIPQLTMRRARRTISAIRRTMLGNVNVVDPADPDARERLRWDGEQELDERIELAFLGDKITTFALAVSSLARTPRVLKQGLGRATEIWNALRGEIDLDEVIALSLLQAVHPSVFALIEQHASALRVRRTTGHNEPRPMEAFALALSTLGLEARASESVNVIVREIFSDQAARRPQGIANNHHADYLQRFLSIPQLGPNEQDQSILQALLADDDEKVVDLLVEERSAAVEDFVRLLPRSRTDGLVVKLVARHLDADVAKWTERQPPGLVPLWRMLRSKRRNQSELESLATQIEQAIDLAAPRNLLLAYELSHWLATSTRGVDDLLPPELRSRIHTRVQRALVEIYKDRPEQLGKQFRQAPPFLLVWICWTIERVRAKTATGIPFELWPQLVPTLVAALIASPTTVAPQLAGLVVHEARRISGPDEWIFDEVQCGVLFGDVDTFVYLVRDVTQNMEVDAMTEAVRSRRTRPTFVQDDVEDAGLDDIEDDDDDVDAADD